MARRFDTTTPGEHTFFVFAQDVLGNISADSVTYTVTDDTGPTVTIMTPADGADYAAGQNVIADFTCSDEAGGSGIETGGLETGGSGIDTCVGTVADGAAIDTSTLGDQDFTVTSTDEAGNETEVTNDLHGGGPPDLHGRDRHGGPRPRRGAHDRRRRDPGHPWRRHHRRPSG